MELTEEWVNDGDRDGRYWLEQVIIANTLFFSFILFLIAVFMQDYFALEGVFTASQLLFELPVVYVIFAVTVIGFLYILLLFGLIVFELFTQQINMLAPSKFYASIQADSKLEDGDFIAIPLHRSENVQFEPLSIFMKEQPFLSIEENIFGYTISTKRYP